RRAQLYHTFLHHELQAAELMAWALLAFPEAPAALRRGFLRVALDELRHVGLYGELIAGLGFHVGDFPVRDWFWQRVPSCASVEQFLAVMGVGFEGGNLDHAPRFAARLREVGDQAGARVQDVICEEEIAHVHLATTWLARLGGLSFEAWGALLPAPLSPMLFRGRPLNLRDRARAGLDAEFLGALDAWQPEPPACNRSPGS
nr:ferritin-like domain-containing protein [Polyangiaceae bacterium]